MSQSPATTMVEAVLKTLKSNLDPIADRIRALEATLQELQARVDAFDASPPVKFLGAYSAGRRYPKGSLVIHAGSLWFANFETGEPPNGTSDWLLCCKNGALGAWR